MDVLSMQDFRDFLLKLRKFRKIRIEQIKHCDIESREQMKLHREYVTLQNIIHSIQEFIQDSVNSTTISDV
jgi:hypothetical protein